MSTNQDKIKVIIADDDRIIREGFVHIISQTPDITVVDKAKDGMELLDKIRTLDLDMVLLDLDMPEKSGWEVMRQLKLEYPELPIIIFSVHPEEEYAVPCFKEGASGYLNKLGPLDSLVDAIHQVAKGEKFISPRLAKKIAFDLCDDTKKQPHESLSPREFQVFCLIASGKSVNEISDELSLSAATVSTYRARVLEKMKMKKNAELIHYAFQHGILK